MTTSELDIGWHKKVMPLCWIAHVFKKTGLIYMAFGNFRFNAIYAAIV